MHYSGQQNERRFGHYSLMLCQLSYAEGGQYASLRTPIRTGDPKMTSSLTPGKTSCHNATCEVHDRPVVRKPFPVYPKLRQVDESATGVEDVRGGGGGDWPAQPDDQEVPMQKVLHEIRAREKQCAGSALEMPQGMQVRG